MKLFTFVNGILNKKITRSKSRNIARLQKEVFSFKKFDAKKPENRA